MTESLVEKLTPSENFEPAVERVEILEDLAEICFEQNACHLATKKFTQAGNRIKVGFT